MEPQQTDILIIGAGLTGLTTGFWLTRAGKDIHILEKADRVGGQIHTFREKDFVYESGPNTHKPLTLRRNSNSRKIYGNNWYAQIGYGN